MTKVSNIPGLATLGRMIMVVMMMVVRMIAAAHVMVMRLLRQPGLLFVADDLRAVFAELAIHVGFAAVNLRDAFDIRIDD
jgi:hypothetical protein